MRPPEWLHDAIFYQIFPDRFANADPCLDPAGMVPWVSAPTRTNFFGGDLRGIEQQLDHIVSVGANAIYLNPIFEANTNHRYDCVDYFSIDHRLGSLTDFREFLAACHSHGIRVVLDGVFNHCGSEHPYFTDAVSQQVSSEYANWFYLADYPVASEPEPNYRTFAGCWDLPKWNVFNDSVRRHHLDVARYWLEQGIDGWRLDVPWLVPQAFWRRFRTTVKTINPEAYIVAEEWRDPEMWLQGDTCDATMNYTLRKLVLEFTADRSIDATELARGMNVLRDRIPIGFHHAMLNLLGSHDTERVLTRHQGSRSACLLSHALLFCSLGAPMIYYGDEVGLEGDNDPDCRGAMPWNEAMWDGAMLAGVRSLSTLRHAKPALRYGTQEYVAIDPDTVMVVRDFERERVICVAHRGEGVTIPAHVVPLVDGQLLYASDQSVCGVRREDGELINGTVGEIHEQEGRSVSDVRAGRENFSLPRSVKIGRNGFLVVAGRPALAR